MSAPRSLTRHLINRLVLGLALLSLAMAAYTYLFVSHRFKSQFDEALAAQCRALASLVQENQPGQLEFEFADELMPEFEAERHPQFFQVWRPDGHVLEKSRSLESNDLPKFSGALNAPEFRDIRIGADSQVRSAGVRFKPELSDEAEKAFEAGKRPPPEPVTIVVARSSRQLQATLRTLLLACCAGALLLPLTAALLVWWTVRRGLQPVYQLSEQVSQIDTRSLDRRINVAAIPAELEPVQQRINSLLERLDAAFARERRFTSSVSHELKTPLGEAMTVLTMAQRWPEDHALQARSSADALDALRRMQHLIETLLKMTRESACNIEKDTVDLQPILDSCILQATPVASERGVTFVSRVNRSEHLSVNSNPLLLQSVIGNVLGNAAEYAPVGSEVRISLARQNGCVYIDCTNSAPELTGTDASQLLEPLWRKDASRTDATHSGLGLAIAASLSEALGGKLHAELSQDNELTLRIELPA